MSGRKESVASLGSLGSSEDSYSDAESEGGARSSWGEQESSCQEIYDICGYIGPSICSDSPDTSLSCLEVATSQHYTHNMVTIFSDNVGLSSSGCSEHEANNPQSGQQGPGAPCNYLDIYSVSQLCLLSTVQVNKMIQEIEQKRVECNRLMRNRNKRRISKFLKTPEMLEQEAQQAKWKSSKVGL